MKKIQMACIALAVALFIPMTASADLIQEVTVFDLMESGDTEIFDGGLRFGTLIFPNEFQDGSGTVELGQFIANRDSFPGFDNLNGTGVAIPEVLPLFGFWSINDDWELEGIFAWTRFDLGDMVDESSRNLTLVFGRAGNICATFQPTEISPGSCFRDTVGTARFSYGTTPAHAVPEPGTLALFAIGLIGVGVARRKAG